MFIKRKESDWTWNTSSGLSGSYGIVGGTGATFVLNQPYGGTASFCYISVGVGLSVGGKFSLGGSTKDNMSTGTLFISDDFPGDELSTSDLTGFCLVMEASAAFRMGRTGAVMLLGIPAARMPESLLKDLGLGMALTAGATVGRSMANKHPVLAAAAGFGPYLITRAGEALAKDHGADLPDFLRSNAKAALFTYSESNGAQIGIGALGSVGYVWVGALDAPPITFDSNWLPVPVDHYHRIVAVARETIPFPSDVLFDFDKAILKPDAELALWGLTSQIQQKRPGAIVVEGHTDALGSTCRNLELSKQRADAVAGWLIVRRIVKASNVTTIGLGHKFPAFPDKLNGQDNPDGRMRNRRIEIRFLAK